MTNYQNPDGVGFYVAAVLIIAAAFGLSFLADAWWR